MPPPRAAGVLRVGQSPQEGSEEKEINMGGSFFSTLSWCSLSSSSECSFGHRNTRYEAIKRRATKIGKGLGEK